MKYKCGMFGGSFNPLHMGHVRCIIEAANQCKCLLIVISEGVNREEIDVRVRYRWIYQLTRHIGNVRIFILRDEAKSKDEYDENCWLDDAEKVKFFAGEKIDAVFCGSDYGNNSFWSKCYPDADHVIIERDNVSSTEIREDVYGNWDNLPNIVKPYYVKKVLLIGGESSGKSTLTVNLANYYNTNYVEEVGREISARSGTDLMMVPEDFADILYQHKIRQLEALKSSNRVLFEDTDCLTTLFYIDFLEDKNKKKNAELARVISKHNNYDLILFLEPDVAFIQDGDRSEVIAADREKYSNAIKEIYSRYGFEFECIDGDYHNRFKSAVCKIDRLFKKASCNEGI